eukprot:Em0009g145a
MAADSDEEFESFQVTEQDLLNELHPKKRKFTKEDRIYGMWAENDSDDDDRKGAYTQPVRFVSSGTQGGKKDDDNESEEEDLDAEAQRILQGLEEKEVEKEGGKIGIGKFRTAAVEKNRTLGSFAPAQAATEKKVPATTAPPPTITSTTTTTTTSTMRKTNVTMDFGQSSGRVDREWGRWEKHTTGFGSRMLSKMGYVPGKGLGSAGVGIVNPVKAAKNTEFGDGSVKVAKPADAAPSGASLFIPEDREDEEEQKKLEEQLQQWRTTDPSKKARPKYVYKTVEELKQSGKKQFGSLAPKIHTSVKKRVLSSYEEIHERHTVPDSAFQPEDSKVFLPELLHNITLLVEKTENDILQSDRSLQYNKDLIVNLSHERISLEQDVFSEQVQIEKLSEILQTVEMCENRLAVGPPLNLKNSHALSAIGVALTFPLIKNLLKGWDMLTTPYFALDVFQTWREILREAESSHAVPSPDNMGTGQHSGPAGYAPDCSMRWMCGDPTVDTVPIHAWVHPWLPIMAAAVIHIDSLILQKSVLKSYSSAHKILEPWVHVLTREAMEVFLVRTILPKLAYCLDTLVINPHQQQIGTCMPIHKVLQNWLSSNANFNEVTKWYTGWKGMIDAELLNEPMGETKASEVTSRTSLQNALTAPMSISFKDVVEKLAEDNGLLFMPIAGQKQYEGKALYSFGKVAVYIDRDSSLGCLRLVRGKYISMGSSVPEAYHYHTGSVRTMRNVPLQEDHWLLPQINISSVTLTAPPLWSCFVTKATLAFYFRTTSSLDGLEVACTSKCTGADLNCQIIPPSYSITTHPNGGVVISLRGKQVMLPRPVASIELSSTATLTYANNLLAYNDLYSIPAIALSSPNCPLPGNTAQLPCKVKMLKNCRGKLSKHRRPGAFLQLCNKLQVWSCVATPEENKLLVVTGGHSVLDLASSVCIPVPPRCALLNTGGTLTLEDCGGSGRSTIARSVTFSRVVCDALELMQKGVVFEFSLDDRGRLALWSEGTMLVQMTDVEVIHMKSTSNRAMRGGVDMMGDSGREMRGGVPALPKLLYSFNGTHLTDCSEHDCLTCTDAYLYVTKTSALCSNDPVLNAEMEVWLSSLHPQFEIRSSDKEQSVLYVAGERVIELSEVHTIGTLSSEWLRYTNGTLAWRRPVPRPPPACAFEQSAPVTIRGGGQLYLGNQGAFYCANNDVNTAIGRHLTAEVVAMATSLSLFSIALSDSGSEEGTIVRLSFNGTNVLNLRGSAMTTLLPGSMITYLDGTLSIQKEGLPVQTRGGVVSFLLFDGLQLLNYSWSGPSVIVPGGSLYIDSRTAFYTESTLLMAQIASIVGLRNAGSDYSLTPQRHTHLSATRLLRAFDGSTLQVTSSWGRILYWYSNVASLVVFEDTPMPPGGPSSILPLSGGGQLFVDADTAFYSLSDPLSMRLLLQAGLPSLSSAPLLSFQYTITSSGFLVSLLARGSELASLDDLSVTEVEERPTLTLGGEGLVLVEGNSTSSFPDVESLSVTDGVNLWSYGNIQLSVEPGLLLVWEGGALYSSSSGLNEHISQLILNAQMSVSCISTMATVQEGVVSVLLRGNPVAQIKPENGDVCLSVAANQSFSLANGSLFDTVSDGFAFRGVRSVKTLTNCTLRTVYQSNATFVGPGELCVTTTGGGVFFFVLPSLSSLHSAYLHVVDRFQAPSLAVPSFPSTFVSTSGSIVSIGQSVGVFAGLHLTLLCAVTRGNPLPNIQWTLKGNLLGGGTGDKHAIDGFQGTMTIFGVDHSDAGEYKCTATNIKGSAQAQSVLTVLAAGVQQRAVLCQRVFNGTTFPVDPTLTTHQPATSTIHQDVPVKPDVPNTKLRLPRGRLRSLLGKLPRRQTVAQCVLHGAVQRHACEGGGVLGVHPGGTGGTSHPPAVQHGGVSRLAKRRLWELGPSQTSVRPVLERNVSTSGQHQNGASAQLTVCKPERSFVLKHQAGQK